MKETLIYDNIDEQRAAKWNKSITKRLTLDHSIHMKYSEIHRDVR